MMVGRTRTIAFRIIVLYSVMDPNLFELDSAGQRAVTLNKIYVWAKLLFISALVTGLFNLYNNYDSIKSFPILSKSAPDSFKAILVANICIGILFCLTLPLQAYFFYQFAAKSKEATASDNSEQFTLSLNWLLKNVIVGTIFLGLHAIWAVISVCFLKN